VHHRLSYASVTATLALVLAIGGTTAVGAKVMLTGDNVKDGSLTGADIHNDSLTGADIRAGSLGSNAFSSAARAHLRGATGAIGATGPKGDSGPRGLQGPAGAGVTALALNGDDAANYQDLTPLLTISLTNAGDYVLFANVTAHNTGANDDNFNCGLFIDGSAFGGGGTSLVAGATTSFSSVGAINLRADDSKAVNLKCQGGGVTTYDLSHIELRVHNLG
jgi:hypothetical protein